MALAVQTPHFVGGPNVALAVQAPHFVGGPNVALAVQAPHFEGGPNVALAVQAPHFVGGPNVALAVQAPHSIGPSCSLLKHNINQIRPNRASQGLQSGSPTIHEICHNSSLQDKCEKCYITYIVVSNSVDA